MEGDQNCLEQAGGPFKADHEREPYAKRGRPDTRAREDTLHRGIINGTFQSERTTIIYLRFLLPRPPTAFPSLASATCSPVPAIAFFVAAAFLPFIFLGGFSLSCLSLPPFRFVTFVFWGAGEDSEDCSSEAAFRLFERGVVPSEAFAAWLSWDEAPVAGIGIEWGSENAIRQLNFHLATRQTHR